MASQVKLSHLLTTRGHDDLRNAVRQLCAAFDLAYWDKCDGEHRFPREFYEAFARAGYLNMIVPEEFGGGGASLAETCAVLEEVAASGGAINACSSVHLTLISMSAVIRHASAELRSEVLPQLAEGRLIVSFGVTEPNAGTDTTRITSAARREGDKYVVNAMKTWNSGAQEAEMVLLLVRTSPYDSANRTAGLSLLLVDLNAPEVTIRPISKIGRNAVDSNELYIDGLAVPADRLVGEEGRGFYHLLDGLNAERVMLASEAIGVGRWALRRSSEYASQRVVFDRPIGQNQAVQHPLAACYIELAAAACLIRDAATAYDAQASQRECGELANMAKYAATEAAFKTTDAAMQTLGGYSFAREFHIGRHWIESRLQKIAPVNNQMVLNFVAEKMLGLPRSY
jgi:acyl-CoA dehydrogenase